MSNNENDTNKKPVVKRGRPKNVKKVTFVEPVKIIQPVVEEIKIIQPIIEVPKLVQPKEIIPKIIQPKDFYIQQLEFFVLQINNVIEELKKI